MAQPKFGLDPKVIESLNNIFSNVPEINEVVIYGSRAKGNYRPGSDIDLTIKGDVSDVSVLFKIENQIEELLLPYKVDLSLFNLIENQSLREHIERVGVTFYK